MTEATTLGGLLNDMGRFYKAGKLSSAFLLAKAKTVGFSNLFTAGFTGYQFLDERQEALRNGHSEVGAALKAAGSSATDLMLFNQFGGYYLAYSMLQPFVSSGAHYLYDNLGPKGRRQLGKEMKQQAFQTAQFQDTQQTYTMRQAGMALASRSRYNTQQAMLGNEAKYMHK